MAQLSQISVSIDTDDPELLRRTRRSVNIDTILANIQNVRARAKQRKIQGPTFAFICVVHNLNVMHLDRFVAFGLSQGIKVFGFCNLCKPPSIAGAVNVDHVSALPPEQLALAKKKIDIAEHKAKAGNARCGLPAGLRDSMTKAMTGRCEGTRISGARSLRFSGEQKPGETRDCLNPWSICVVCADGAVKPCCFQPATGSLKDHSLFQVLNNESAVRLRRNIVLGDLDPCCRSCPDKPYIPNEALLKKLSVRIPRTKRQAAVFKEAYWLHMVARELQERIRIRTLGR